MEKLDRFADAFVASLMKFGVEGKVSIRKVTSGILHLSSYQVVHRLLQLTGGYVR